MKILVTGASGYIGKVVVDHAVKAGHIVEGFVRTQEGAAKVAALGATPVIGDLTSLDVLAAAASRADVILHLAYIHDFTMDYNIVIKTEVDAVTALAKGAKGKPIITTAGTAVSKPAADGGETDETAPVNESFILSKRYRAETAVLDLAKQGAHVIAIRLPQYVFGRGGSYFVPLLMQQAAKHGVSAWVDGSGSKHTSAVDVDDVARFYLAVAAKPAPAGSLYNCTGETGVSLRQLAEAVGEAVGVPARALPRADVVSLWGEFLTNFVDYDNRSSSAKAQRDFNWHPQPKHKLLADITVGSYTDMAKQLRQQRAAAK